MIMLAYGGGGHSSGGAHGSAAHVSVSEPAAHFAPAPKIRPLPRPVPIVEETVVRPPSWKPGGVVIAPHGQNFHYRDCTEAEKKDKRHHCK